MLRPLFEEARRRAGGAWARGGEHGERAGSDSGSGGGSQTASAAAALDGGGGQRLGRRCRGIGRRPTRRRCGEVRRRRQTTRAASTAARRRGMGCVASSTIRTRRSAHDPSQRTWCRSTRALPATTTPRPSACATLRDAGRRVLSPPSPRRTRRPRRRGSPATPPRQRPRRGGDGRAPNGSVDGERAAASAARPRRAAASSPARPRWRRRWLLVPAIGRRAAEAAPARVQVKAVSAPRAGSRTT